VCVGVCKGRWIQGFTLGLFIVNCGLYGALVTINCTANFPKGSKGALSISVITISALFIVHEFFQGIRVGCRYFLSVWNWVDILANFGLILTSIFSLIGQCSSTLRIFCGVTLVMLAFELIGLVRPFKQTGALVRMLTQILIDVKWFFVIQIVLLFGFTSSLIVVMDHPVGKNKFVPPLAFLTGFRMMLSDWETTDLYEGQSSSVQVVALMIFVVYAMFVPVVCMNTLIAIMTDSYDRIKEKEVEFGYLQKAEVLLDIDAVYGCCLKLRCCRIRKRCFPKYLHIMKTTFADDVLQNDQWYGKIKALEGTIEPLHSKMADIQAEVKRLMSILEDHTPQGQEFVSENGGSGSSVGMGRGSRRASRACNDSEVNQCSG